MSKLYPGVTTLTRKAGKRTPKRTEHWFRDGRTWTRLAGTFNKDTGAACAVFKADYAAARNGQPTPSSLGQSVEPAKPAPRMDVHPESFAWLVARYCASPKKIGRAPMTRSRIPCPQWPAPAALPAKLHRRTAPSSSPWRNAAMRKRSTQEWAVLRAF